MNRISLMIQSVNKMSKTLVFLQVNRFIYRYYFLQVRLRYRLSLPIPNARADETLTVTASRRAVQDGDEDESMETAMIEKAFDKMSTLLRIGFGAAGNAIISKSLMGTGELNAMLPGQVLKLTFLSLQLTFLSLKLTFLSLKLYTKIRTQPPHGDICHMYTACVLQGRLVFTCILVCFVW